MNQAQLFRAIMKSRWEPQPDSELAAELQLEPAQLSWLSANALRVAQSLDIPCTWLSSGLIRIDFPDGTACFTTILGNKFI